METQLKVTDQLGKLAGRPETNGLHVHPLFKSKDNIPYDDNGNTHENVYVINTEGESLSCWVGSCLCDCIATAQKKMYKSMAKVQSTEPKDLGREWHSE